MYSAGTAGGWCVVTGGTMGRFDHCVLNVVSGGCMGGNFHILVATSVCIFTLKGSRQRKLRDYLGIFPNMEGGILNPKTSVIKK